MVTGVLNAPLKYNGKTIYQGFGNTILGSRYEGASILEINKVKYNHFYPNLWIDITILPQGGEKSFLKTVEPEYCCFTEGGGF